MLNIIKAELYKMLHRRCTLSFYLVFAVGGFLMNGLLRIALAESDVSTFGAEIMGFWSEVVCMTSWFLVYMIAQLIHSQESKTGVLKNSVSFGYSRTKLYISRYIAQLITLIVSIVVVVASILLGNLVFNGGCSKELLEEFLGMVAAEGILWIGALSLAHALAMCLNSNTMATVLYLLYFFLGNNFIQNAHRNLPGNQIISFMDKYEIFLFSNRCVMGKTVGENLGLFFVIGGVYLAVSFTVGLLVYQRKEVK